MVRNSTELESLAAIVHGTSAIGWSLVVAGGSLAIADHVLGVVWNDARGNRFESRFHRAAIVVGSAAVLFGLVAIGVDSLAAVGHARDARATSSSP